MNYHPDKIMTFFDLETTGLNKANDRICSIAVVQLDADFCEVFRKYTLVNPEMPIPKGASEIHGITDDMVVDAPTFRQIAAALHDRLSGTDYYGYNIDSFDIPILQEEFLRCSMTIPQGDIIDIYSIFRQKEPRTLAGAVKFYTGREMENAHNAEVDVNETIGVFLGQQEMYKDLPTTTQQLKEFTAGGRKNLDYDGRFIVNSDGDTVISFGKHKGMPAKENLSYLRWMLNGDFTLDTKNWCNKLIKQYS